MASESASGTPRNELPLRFTFRKGWVPLCCAVCLSLIHISTVACAHDDDIGIPCLGDGSLVDVGLGAQPVDVYKRQSQYRMAATGRQGALLRVL